MRYIVATDGSTESDAAARYAATQATALDAAIEVVHVITPAAELVDGEVVLPGEDAALEQGEQVLADAAALVREVAAEHDAALEVETELLTGRPANAITGHARAVEADAIYVGHRGISEEHAGAVGSVAKSVVDRASVPVTIMR